jgi:hypothetical protein
VKGEKEARGPSVRPSSVLGYNTDWREECSQLSSGVVDGFYLTVRLQYCSLGRFVVEGDRE